MRLFRLRPEPFRALSGWVQEVEGYWQEQLGSFQTHVKRRRGARKKK